ncbi:MAG: hypothetical protein MMC23_001661 [Stictis urceolatum]|nr:hypothetical protein [Stictis urceolata]
MYPKNRFSFRCGRGMIRVWEREKGMGSTQRENRESSWDEDDEEGGEEIEGGRTCGGESVSEEAKKRRVASPKIQYKLDSYY